MHDRLDPRRALACLTVVLALVVGACGSGGEDPPGGATSTTAGARERAALVAAYRAHWQAFIAATDPPSPDHPRLVATTSGRHLADIQALLGNDAEVGIVRRVEVELHPRVTALRGDRASVTDCYEDTLATFVAGTGQVVSPRTTETISSVFRLRRIGGAWKVVERIKEDGPCVTGDS
jgi:hypothetical protein